MQAQPRFDVAAKHGQRLLHAAGMAPEPDIRPLRAAGALGTVAALALAAALALGAGLGLW